MFWLGAACLITGAIVLGIVGLLSIKHNYSVHNEAALAAFKGKNVAKTTVNAYQAVFSKPRTRWWYIAGIVFWLSGLFLIFNFMH